MDGLMTKQLDWTAFFMVQVSHPYMTTGKTIALTRWTFVSCYGVRGTEYNTVLKEFAIHHHYPYHSLSLGQTKGGDHSPAHQQKIGLKIYWAWPCTSEQDPNSPQQVPSTRELPQASYPYPSEGRQSENHTHRKLTRLITWITALSNSMKLWTMPCRATRDGQVMMQSSDKTWSTGEGNGKPLQYSCLENPMNSLKRSPHTGRRHWWPTPVLLPGKSRGRRSLVGCSPWGRTESTTDTT